MVSSSLNLTIPVTNSTSTRPANNSTLASAIPLYPNATVHSGYGTSTLNIAKEMRATSPASNVNGGVANQAGMSFILLFIGLVATACLT